MRNINGTPGYSCDAHLYRHEYAPATTHVNVWGGVWNGEVSDLCDEHTQKVRDNESAYTKVRYTKIEENINA